MSPDLWIVLTGALAAGSCGLLGCFLVLRRMALIGDAISHAVLPGIVLAFLLSGSRAPLPMLLGAATLGLLAAALIQSLHGQAGLQQDAAIGITFTALFALGVVLVSLYAGQVDLDQECVLYGEIAYTPFDLLLVGGRELGPRPTWTLGGVFLLDLALVTLLFKELKASSFDPQMAACLGINVGLVHYLLMGAVSLTTVAAFESVGAILVVAMLIVPAATAYLLTDRLSTMLGLSVAVGAASSLGGYLVARKLDASIAGAMAVVAGVLFVLALLLSPTQGLVARWGARRALPALRLPDRAPGAAER